MLAAALLMLAPAPIDAFEAMLNAQDSATMALTQWCNQRAIAPEARITATLIKGEDALAAPDLPDTLGTEEPGYRHVRLSCGAHVLSEAHNWYNPALLTAEMNHLLATTDTPFGKVVAPLNFRREKLASRRGPCPVAPPTRSWPIAPCCACPTGACWRWCWNAIRRQSGQTTLIQPIAQRRAPP
jgi:hypothetical protein